MTRLYLSNCPFEDEWYSVVLILLISNISKNGANTMSVPVGVHCQRTSIRDDKVYLVTSSADWFGSAAISIHDQMSPCSLGVNGPRIFSYSDFAYPPEPFSTTGM